MNRWQIPAARRRRDRTRPPRVELTALGDRWPSYTLPVHAEDCDLGVDCSCHVANALFGGEPWHEHVASTADVAPVTMLRNFRRRLFGEPR